MFNNVEEARTELHISVGIIDEYIKALNRKDQKILEYIRIIDELELQVETLTRAMFPEIPKGGEGSE